MKLALTCLVAVGCSQGESPRQLACARADEHFAATPRRYWDPVAHDAVDELCSRGDRERDCAEVRSSFERMLFDLVPARETGIGIRDEAALQALERRRYRDPEVGSAVREMIHESGAAFFTPNDSSEARAIDARARFAYDKLAMLCQLTRR